MVSVIDKYEEIEGFINITKTGTWDYDPGQWKSECGHYVITYFVEEGNYGGFDTYYMPEGNTEDPDWDKDSEGAVCLNWQWTLDNAMQEIVEHEKRQKDLTRN